MNHLKVAIADGYPESLQEIAGILQQDSDIEVVGIAQQEQEILDIIHMTRPDLLILSVMLLQSDGFAVMERLFRIKHAYAPKVLMTVLPQNEWLASAAYALGASYVMLKPVRPDLLIQRLKQVAGSDDHTAVIHNEPYFPYITDLLRHIGMPSHLHGYAYLQTALSICLQDTSYLDPITKRLYPYIADQHCTTVGKVERSIRNAIEVAWCRGNADFLTQIFGYTIHPAKGKPTNREFIYQLIQYLRLHPLLTRPLAPSLPPVQKRYALTIPNG